MAKIGLRAYLREIENLIDRGQLDEAQAHCKHILSIYPKQLDAYRSRFSQQLNEGCCRGIVPFSIITGDGKLELLRMIEAHMNHSLDRKKEAV